MEYLQGRKKLSRGLKVLGALPFSLCEDDDSHIAD